MRQRLILLTPGDQTEQLDGLDRFPERVETPAGHVVLLGAKILVDVRLIVGQHAVHRLPHARDEGHQLGAVHEMVAGGVGALHSFVDT